MGNASNRLWFTDSREFRSAFRGKGFGAPTFWHFERGFRVAYVPRGESASTASGQDE
jgi:hypothetical protein